MKVTIIEEGSEIDQLPFGVLCSRAAREIVDANPDHRFHRLELYRQIEYNGRAYYVKVRFTLPFATLLEEERPKPR